MKKLEEIPKKAVFEVPEGYFEKLPSRIAARIEAERTAASTGWWPEFGWAPALRLALPVVIVAAIAIFLYRLGPSSSEPEQILASVSTEALYEFLEESDLTTDELIETIDAEGFDIEALEEEAYPEIDLSDDELEALELELSQP